ncbi:MAG: hypothetical protein ABI860_07900 [Gemmatimonadales bacterium]
MPATSASASGAGSAETSSIVSVTGSCNLHLFEEDRGEVVRAGLGA